MFVLGPTVQDDHTPFQREGLERIFYIITRPFPSVWHTLNDNMDAVDMSYVRRLAQLMRVWVAQYMKYPAVASNGSF
jgi:glutaminyl-peptide cyclotransferase